MWNTWTPDPSSTQHSVGGGVAWWWHQPQICKTTLKPPEQPPASKSEWEEHRSIFWKNNLVNLWKVFTSWFWISLCCTSSNAWIVHWPEFRTIFWEDSRAERITFQVSGLVACLDFGTTKIGQNPGPWHGSRVESCLDETNLEPWNHFRAKRRGSCFRFGAWFLNEWKRVFLPFQPSEW